MSAPSYSTHQFDRAAFARDACFSGDDSPADELPTAEHVPPVCPVTAPPREVTRQEILQQTLRLEVLLSLWRMEQGSLAGFWEAHPESIPSPAMAASTCNSQSSPPAKPHPAPVTDQDYISQVALELFGNQAA